MAAFDFDRLLRWARFAPERTLSRRPDADLAIIGDSPPATAVLLDTCVYIDQLHGRAPFTLERLADSSVFCHSTVSLQEMMHSVGALRPDDPRSRQVIAQIRGQLTAIRPHRLFAPDAETSIRAGLLAGIMARVQGYGADRASRTLKDCTLFLQAHKLGLTLLTANIADFDILQQMLRGGRVLFYRRSEG